MCQLWGFIDNGPIFVSPVHGGFEQGCGQGGVPSLRVTCLIINLAAKQMRIKVTSSSTHRRWSQGRAGPHAGIISTCPLHSGKLAELGSHFQSFSMAE